MKRLESPERWGLAIPPSLEGCLLATVANVESLGSVALTAASGFFVVFCFEIDNFFTAPKLNSCLTTRGAVWYFK